MTLKNLKTGERGRIKEVGFNAAVKRRFSDFGLVSGTEITALYESPLHDPVAYLVKGSVIALRKADAEKILIERLEKDER